MKPKSSHLGHQAGYMLLEALTAILIFSIGILGVVGLQAVSIKETSAAKYRIDASFLANQLIGQMWTSDRTPESLQANFISGSPGGPLYNTWLGAVKDPAPGTVRATLPGIDANPPTVTVIDASTANLGAVINRSLVTITIRWQFPDEQTGSFTPPASCAPAPHCFITMAMITQ